MKRIFLGLMLLAIASSNAVCADNLDPIRTILQLPENQIDLGKAKLTIDKMIDPRIDIKANLQRLDSMAAEIQSKLASNASDQDKLQALRTYIYTAGAWNGYLPYSYDLSDPSGTRISNKLLPNYMTTKNGNCISMPILFTILGQRLGLDVTLAIAPEHFFVKYRDGLGNQINLETTSGAKPARDIWMWQQSPMTDEAIANGVYMRALSKKEAVAEMVQVLAEYYSQQHRYEQMMQASDLILKYSPKSVAAMLHNGHACAEIFKEQFLRKYPGPNLIPPEKRPYFVKLERDNQLWYAKAEALGWREPTREQEAQYLQTIKKVRQQSIP